MSIADSDHRVCLLQIPTLEGLDYSERLLHARKMQSVDQLLGITPDLPGHLQDREATSSTIISGSTATNQEGDELDSTIVSMTDPMDLDPSVWDPTTEMAGLISTLPNHG
jgi:hypothetical protein